jgi:hypothetical protein
VSSGESDAIRPIFGMSLDDYRLCAHSGCSWRVYRALLCTDHGGRAPTPEYRADEFGKGGFRNGYSGEVISPLRAS